jgi:hypothetical protein
MLFGWGFIVLPAIVDASLTGVEGPFFFPLVELRDTYQQIC